MALETKKISMRRESWLIKSHNIPVSLLMINYCANTNTKLSATKKKTLITFNKLGLITIDRELGSWLYLRSYQIISGRDLFCRQLTVDNIVTKKYDF